MNRRDRCPRPPVRDRPRGCPSASACSTSSCRRLPCVPPTRVCRTDNGHHSTGNRTRFGARQCPPGRGSGPGAAIHWHGTHGRVQMSDNGIQPPLFSQEALAALSRKVHAWEEGPLAKTLSRQPERRESFSTSSTPVQRLY